MERNEKKGILEEKEDIDWTGGVGEHNTEKQVFIIFSRKENRACL